MMKRMLVRWSASSLSMTTPSPLKAEPSRRMTGPLLQSLVGLGLEIMGVDRLEARLLDAEIFETAVHRYALRGRLVAHVAVGMQPQLADPGLFDGADAGNARKRLG